MAIKIIFTEFTDFATQENYIKTHPHLNLSLIDISNLNITLEVNQPHFKLIGHAIVEFDFKFHNALYEIKLVCTPLKIESFEKSTKLEFKITQYNKKEWSNFIKILSEQQDHLSELLVQMRGRE